MTGPTRVSAAGRALLHEFEDCVLVAYPDPKTGGEPWTCGWGETEGVTPTTCWSQAEADRRFEASLAKREAIVLREVKVPLTQGQFDAMVSILYNVGEGRVDRPGVRGKDGIIRLRDGRPSTLLRKLNAGDYEGAGLEFLKWISPGSAVENGLRRRRKAELVLFRSSLCAS
jgi:lysozyme